MYKVKVNDGEEITIDISGKEISIEGTATPWEMINTGKNRFHILRNNRSYNCELLSVDDQNRNFEVKLNSKVFRVSVKDRFDELLRELGMDKVSSQKINVVKSPMPGLVLKILVKEGDEIKQGTSLLILEAMKMENVIKSPGEGKVKSIKVKEHDAVEKSHVLVEIA